MITEAEISVIMCYMVGLLHGYWFARRRAASFFGTER